MIAAEVVQDVSKTVVDIGVDESSVQKLREAFPDVHFTYCMDDDIAVNAKPVVEQNNFNLYLVDGREHCLCLTNDNEVATGIVLAEVIDDDE